MNKAGQPGPSCRKGSGRGRRMLGTMLCVDSDRRLCECSEALPACECSEGLFSRSSGSEVVVHDEF